MNQLKEKYYVNNSTSSKNHAHGTQIAEFQETLGYFFYLKPMRQKPYLSLVYLETGTQRGEMIQPRSHKPLQHNSFRLQSLKSYNTDRSWCLFPESEVINLGKPMYLLRKLRDLPALEISSQVSG